MGRLHTGGGGRNTTFAYLASLVWVRNGYRCYLTPDCFIDSVVALAAVALVLVLPGMLSISAAQAYWPVAEFLESDLYL